MTIAWAPADEGARGWIIGWRCVPEIRHQRCHVLQMAIALWRDGDLRRPQAEGAGGREPQAEEAAGGDDARRIDAQGDARKKLLTPSLRRRAVTWAVREKSYSQRRACGLVGLHPKTYRYASKRSGDEELRKRLRELASQRRRFGYRRLGLMLKRQGIKLNRKKLYRLYKEERLTARGPQAGPRHPGADGSAAGSQSALVARLRGGHAGQRPALPHSHAGR